MVLIVKLKRPSGWTIAWLLWLLAFLCIELPAAASERGTSAVKTLSRHVWSWLDTWWKVAIFLAFWVSLGLHLAPGIKASVVPVEVFGAALGFVIVWSAFHAPAEGGRVGWLKTFAGKVGGWLKGGGAWLLRRGPLWSSLLVGASVVIPGAAPILRALAAALAGASGGSVDQQTVEAFGAVISGALLLLGAVRKFWRIAKPVLVTAAPK